LFIRQLGCLFGFIWAMSIATASPSSRHYPPPSRTFFLFDTNSYLIPLLTHLYILFRSFYNPRF